MLSLNQILAIFKALAADMRLVREFKVGERDDLLNDKTPAYPLLFCTVGDSSLAGNMVSTPFTFFFLDLVDEDRSNEQEVYSDQQLSALDFIALLKDPDYEDYFEVLPSSPLTRIADTLADSVVGYQITVTLEQFYSMNRCAVPLFSILAGPPVDPGQPEPCPPTEFTATAQSATGILLTWANTPCTPLIVDPVTNFAATVQSHTEILLTWENPA